MSDSLLRFLSGIGFLIAALVALAIAATFLKAYPFAIKRLPDGLLHSRTARTVLWLALAGLLTMPLADALAVISSVPQILSPSAWSSEAMAATTPWGTAPWPLYLLITNALLVASYVAAFTSIWGHVNRSPSPEEGLHRPKWQSAYLIAIVGSLLYHFLQATVMQVLWLQIPVALPLQLKGLAGFSLGWAVGALFLVIAVTLFSNPFSEAEDSITAA
jgi:hypothetical protein